MRHILLVDNDSDEHLIFCNTIECFPVSMNCSYAHSAEQAFEMLEYLSFEFVFVDMNMPRINGIEFIQKLRCIYKSASQLVILYSTHIDDAICQKAKNAGASDCLKKTNSIPTLVSKLAPYFSKE